MSNGRGGARVGGGRRKGSTNIQKRAIRDIIDNVVDMEDVIERVVQLSEGVWVERETADGGIIVYKEKPDAFAAKLLLEYRYGKPNQAVDLTSLGKPVNSISIEIIEPKGQQAAELKP